MLRMCSICLLVIGSTAQDLVITAGLQSGFFKTGNDIGSLNPHDYRPNEFVTNDFIYEGLVAWNGNDPKGLDGQTDTDDDFVEPSLAQSWSTNYDDVKADPSSKYEISFSLRSGVTFHDGARRSCSWSPLSSFMLSSTCTPVLSPLILTIPPSLTLAPLL